VPDKAPAMRGKHLLVSSCKAALGGRHIDDFRIGRLITREIPRLCRGGSKSLTIPAIAPQAPPTKL
jgi:hypothetical protein